MDYLAVTAVIQFSIVVIAGSLLNSPPTTLLAFLEHHCFSISHHVRYMCLTIINEIMNLFLILSFVLHATTVNSEGTITGNSIRFTECSKINMDECNTS